MPRSFARALLAEARSARARAKLWASGVRTTKVVRFHGGSNLSNEGGDERAQGPFGTLRAGSSTAQTDSQANRSAPLRMTVSEMTVEERTAVQKTRHGFLRKIPFAADH